MPWITPRTWADDELVDEDLMNEHVRDNLAHLYNAIPPRGIMWHDDAVVVTDFLKHRRSEPDVTDGAEAVVCGNRDRDALSGSGHLLKEVDQMRVGALDQLGPR